ncbi:MAG: cation:proton antiporter [Gillisia sp.]
MKEHYLILAALGFATLIMAWLPSVSKKIKISFPIILLLIGFLLFWADIPLQWPEPPWNDLYLMYFSEMIVIISLMGAGLKIGTVFSWSAWKRPLLLLIITMPLSMLSAYFIGVYFLALSIPSAILLAAILAPTDPVLAAEVQLNEPSREKEPKDKRRFTLTTEAGLNDGMAFPFTYLAVMVGQAGGWAALNFSDWFWDKLLLKILIGIVLGLLIGRFIGFLMDRLYIKTGLKTFDGFVSLSLTFMAYGLTELLHGYGFLAVFFVGISLRYYEKISGNYKKKMHDFIHEIERLLLVIWIILFGGSLMNGILTFTDWKGIAFALSFVLIIRPLAGLIGLSGIKDGIRTKLAISFLGIRGIGSVFYLAWAFTQYNGFDQKNELYAITAYVILFSIVVHGLTAPSIINYFEREPGKEKPKE